MGILNATPDSFYNQGKDSDPEALLRMGEKMLRDGAVILDIGGASSSPGSTLPSEDEELKRVLPVIEKIYARFPEAWISVDTLHAKVAREAVAAGASIINDISAGSADEAMLDTVATLRVPYIAMHMQGMPATMQANPQYENVTLDIIDYLQKVVHKAVQAGIHDIIIDPGFGFGKTMTHNYTLIRELHLFRMLGKPILVGLSRKSMIWKTLNTNPEAALNGTTALHMVSLQQGASILRAHDVKEAMETITLWKALNG